MKPLFNVGTVWNVSFISAANSAASYRELPVHWRSLRRKSVTRLIGFLAVLILAYPASPVLAELIVIGGGGISNAWPFGSYAAGGEYQQIYLSSRFPGPVTITSIAFASASGFNPPATIKYDVTLGLSNTGASTVAPSTDFATNKGANFATVFSGSLTATLQLNSTFDLIFPINPFTYDPVQGNLLLEVAINTENQPVKGSVSDFDFGGPVDNERNS